MINLKELGLNEFAESKNVNGGSVIGFLINVIIGGLIWDTISNPKDTADAWREGREMAFE